MLEKGRQHGISVLQQVEGQALVWEIWYKRRPVTLPVTQSACTFVPVGMYSRVLSPKPRLSKLELGVNSASTSRLGASILRPKCSNFLLSGWPELRRRQRHFAYVLGAGGVRIAWNIRRVTVGLGWHWRGLDP
jgi:hypothetical protein